MSGKFLEIAPHILHHWEHLYVINKPWGWPTSGHHLEDDDCVQFHLIEHHGSMVWTVHQLDADTTGVCLFSTHKRKVNAYHKLLTHPDTYKEYIAVVAGEPNWEEIEVKAPIGRVGERSLGITPDGKHAHSHFEVLARGNEAALIRARIFTGRTHQIRIHLHSLGHPLLGEEWYGYRNEGRPACDRHIRQALHAYKIRFPQELELPQKSLLPQQEVTAPLTDDLRELVTRLFGSAHVACVTKPRSV